MNDWWDRLERAMDNGRECYKSLISARLDISLLRVKHNPEYKKICKEQEESREMADTLLHKLPKEERLTIEQHYDGQITKENFELEETYMQGMRDCILFLSSLDGFHREVFL